MEIIDEEKKAKLSKDALFYVAAEYLANIFVRYKGQFRHIDHCATPLVEKDARKIATGIIQQQFSKLYDDAEMLNKLLDLVFGCIAEQPWYTISFWDGSVICKPGDERRVVKGPIMSKLNSWRKPEYRNLEADAADLTMFTDFLEKAVVEVSDREMVLNWFAFVVQNEEKKMKWSLFCYSDQKGTGKSTLAKVLTLLLGKDNTVTLNGADEVAGRFNSCLSENKGVVLEEMDVKVSYNQWNKIKTLISDDLGTAERKGVDRVKVEQCTAVLCTSNNLPLFLQANERRVGLVDFGHEGHACGPKSDEFREYMAKFHVWIDHPENIAKLYNGLMEYKIPETFNPLFVNVSKAKTPLMTQLAQSSSEVVADQLKEAMAQDNRRAIPQTALINLCKQSGMHINVNRLPHLLIELGWRQETAKWGGKDYGRKIWVSKGYRIERGSVKGPDGYDYPIDQQPEGPSLELVEAA